MKLTDKEVNAILIFLAVVFVAVIALALKSAANESEVLEWLKQS